MTRPVRIGAPIALIVIGLILALAVANRLSGIDLTMIGWILAGAGIVWLIIEMIANSPRSTVTRESTSVTGTGTRPVVGGDGTVEREVRRDGL